MAAIEIPKDLLPADRRFGAGPSKVRPEALSALVEAAPSYLGTSHRQQPVRAVVGRVRAGISELLSLPEGYEVVLGNGGTTAFWDVATFCLIEDRSQHLSFGEFSSKFATAAAAAPWLAEPQVIASEPGTHPDPETHEGIDAYCLTQNETSTGVVAPVTRPQGHGAAGSLVLVDATSAAGAIGFDPNDVDVYYFSPQKNFGSEGGLWLAACSPAAIERAGRIAESGRFVPASLDFSIALENARLEQTYNTPALTTLFLLASQLDWFNDNGGLEFAAGRAEASSETIYTWSETSSFSHPYVEKPDERSPVVATIDFAPEVDAAAIAKSLRENGVLDTEPYRKLGRNQLRIATFPSIDPEDVEALTSCIDYVVEHL